MANRVLSEDDWKVLFNDGDGRAMKTKRKWRIIPRVSYTNFRKTAASHRAFRSWFSIRRYWGGRIINIGIRHHVVTLDFRHCWLSDLIEPELKFMQKNRVN